MAYLVGMRAINFDSADRQVPLFLQDLPTPALGADEVLLEVVASGVNRADLLQRAGHYPPPPGASSLLGLEVSGYITQAGTRSPVCALLSGGGYAEQVAVPIGQVMPIPHGISVLTAAALPEVAATVYSNLTFTADLAAGETVLIHGGASGIGTFAIQYAKALGARVAVTVGSDRKAAYCRELGADLVINYREQDFVTEVREFTDGNGANVVLDIIGAKYLTRNIEVLATDGRLVIIGLQGGIKADLNLGQLLVKRGTIYTTALRSRSATAKAQICAGLVENIWPMIEARTLKPVVDQVFSVAEAQRAHDFLADSAHIGKVLLAW